MNDPIGQHVRLADFISQNTDRIVSEWSAFAKTLKPASNDMTPEALRDHILEILTFIVRDIRSEQTGHEQVKKSRGDKERKSTPTAAETHTALRMAGGFDIDQMISEYRALRASVIKLWSSANSQMNSEDIIDLTRFNESIDQEIAESVSHYTQKVSYSKDIFLGILSHEIRSPLNVISLSAQLQLKEGVAPERQVLLATQIFDSAARITKIVNNLLDVTRVRFGSGLPVMRAPMDIGTVGQLLVDEMQAANPARSIHLQIMGDTKGEWDSARIGQVFSNLIGNAIHYGFKDTPVTVTVEGAVGDVNVSVHNFGVPIPPEKFASLFASLTRAVTDTGDHQVEVNLGLGLYITEKIVIAHGGTIDVISSEEAGTIFTVRLPRKDSL